MCLTEEYRLVGTNFVCSHWGIGKEKDSLKLTVAVKIEEMQIYKPVIRCHLLVHGEKEKINSPYTNKSVRLIYGTCLQCLYMRRGVGTWLFSAYDHSVTEHDHAGNKKRVSKRDKEGRVKKDWEKEGEGTVEKAELCSGKGTQVISSPSGISQCILLSPRGHWSTIGVSEHSLLSPLPGCLVQHQKKRYMHKRFVQNISQPLKIKSSPESELNNKKPTKKPKPTKAVFLMPLLSDPILRKKLETLGTNICLCCGNLKTENDNFTLNALFTKIDLTPVFRWY